MTARTPTPEQADIIDAFAFGADLVIEAGAGTGKTSTLKMIAGSTSERGVYLAYNKAIATEAAREFPRQVVCKTAHGFAYQAVGKRFSHRLTGPRLTAKDTARILGINQAVRITTERAPLAPQQIARLVMETVKRFCYSADDTITAAHVPPVTGLEDPALVAELRRLLVPLAVRAWETDLTQLDGALKFDHDVYLKMWCLSRPQLGADYVLLDEAQDSNPAVAALVTDQQAQRIMVGDRCQSIYGWRGATDAMSTFDGQTFLLSQSFRFGQRIADEANRWLRVLDARLRLIGSPAIASKVGPLDAPDAILCRTNAGAVAAAVTAMDAGRAAALVGGGQDIKRLAEAALTLRMGQGCDHPELFAFNSWAEVQAYVEEDAAGADLAVFVRLIDAHTPAKVIAIVDRLAEEDQADVIVSTAHKSKGREWATVTIGGDFREPRDDDDGMPGPIPRDDAMLAYVAVTRARAQLDREGLMWVDRHLAWLEVGLPQDQAYAASLALPAPRPAPPVTEPVRAAVFVSTPARIVGGPAAAGLSWTADPCPQCGVLLERDGSCTTCTPPPPGPVRCPRCGSAACTCDPAVLARWLERTGQMARAG